MLRREKRLAEKEKLRSQLDAEDDLEELDGAERAAQLMLLESGGRMSERTI